MNSHVICSPCQGYPVYDECYDECYDDDYPDQIESPLDGSFLEDEILDWSRNRQEEWYNLFRKEYGLTEEEYVDEQDLLDWLGAYFTISRSVTQEI